MCIEKERKKMNERSEEVIKFYELEKNATI